MGLETVKQEIIGSAKDAASSIIAEAKKEAEKILKDCTNNAREMKEKSEAEMKKYLEVAKRQKLASAEIEAKKILLDAKKSLIEGAFASAFDRMAILDDKKREALLKKIMQKVKSRMDAACFFCNPRDAKFLKGMEVKPSDIIGGLIAENKEETIRLNYSFESILESIKEKEIMEISRILKC